HQDARDAHPRQAGDARSRAGGGARGPVRGHYSPTMSLTDWNRLAAEYDERLGAPEAGVGSRGSVKGEPSGAPPAAGPWGGPSSDDIAWDHGLDAEQRVVIARSEYGEVLFRYERERIELVWYDLESRPGSYGVGVLRDGVLVSWRSESERGSFDDERYEW